MADAGKDEGPGGPKDRLLPWRCVRDIIGLSRTTAWRLQQRGAFPLPLQVSPGRVGWWESELNAWKAERAKAQAQAQAEAARAGRDKLSRRPPREPRLINTARSPSPSPPTQAPAISAAAPTDNRRGRGPNGVTAKRSAGRHRLKVHPDQIDFDF